MPDFGQRFNRFEVTVKSGAEHTDFQQSVFVNGQTDSNADRDYTQYTTTLRSAYDLTPGFRPFAEVSTNKRVHDLSVDRFGVDRDSVATAPKIGTSVDLVRTVTGEIAVGYINQMYIAPLPNSGGFLIDGALAWFATPLTTAKLFASTTTTESPLFLVSAVLTRQVGVELDHAFRRWLIGTLKFSLARDVYAGMLRVDNRYAASAALTYMFTRELALKGEYRQEWDRAQRSRLQLRGQHLAFEPATAALAPGSVNRRFCDGCHGGAGARVSNCLLEMKFGDCGSIARGSRCNHLVVGAGLHVVSSRSSSETGRRARLQSPLPAQPGR